MSQENIQAVRRLYGAFNERGLAGLYDHWDPDIEWHDVAELPDADVHRGRDAAARAFQHYLDIGGDFKVEVDEFIEAGDEVVAIWRYRAQGAGSGVPLDQEIGHVWLVKDQRLVRLRQFLSREKALEAAGLRE
jgi:ketosteroid isomerase-like protein